jgi:serine/threonine protein kinase
VPGGGESPTASVLSDAAFDAPPASPGGSAKGAGNHPPQRFDVASADGRIDDVQAALSQNERIGPYVILREIGEGGMGRVYLAMRQDDKFHVRVALKVIRRLGGKRESMVRRFEQERQILAALTHPNIARLLDVGTTADGDPYLVMEYIEGLAITSYCDRNGLNLHQRLGLFRTLCEAVHFAHQNLVVHRDIKPSNVVITPGGTVKLLDFGIAKVLNPNLALFAGDATRTFGPMTPEYASPEQVLGEPISTATDIYSLGVLLYELLSGRRPYRLKTRVREDLRNIICNQTPRRPSIVVTEPLVEGEADAEHEEEAASSTHASTADSVARAREATPQRLRKRLTGDLDNIVLMAMRKEPVKRYASAREFSDDIERHMNGLPVYAAPPSAWYVLRKYVARHRVGVATAAAIALLIVAGTVGTTLGWRKAVNEQRIAERRLQIISEFPESLVEFSQRIAHSANMTEARRQVLALWEKSNARLQAEAGDDPTLRLLLARSYLAVAGVQAGVSTNNVGDVPGAQASLAKAEGILEDLLAAGPASAAVSEQRAVAFMRRGELAQLRDDLPARLAAYENARRVLEAALAGSPESVSCRRRLAAAVLEIGDVLKAQGQVSQAVDAYRDSVKIREELLAANPGDAMTIRDATVGWTRLASMLQAEVADTSDPATLREALALYLKVEAGRQQLLDRAPESTQTQRDLMYARHYVGSLHAQRGEFEQAVAALASSMSLATGLAIADPGNARFVDDFARMLETSVNTNVSIAQQGSEHAMTVRPMIEQLDSSAARLRAKAAERQEHRALADLARDADEARDRLQAATEPQ